jgi:hypothetical protein
MLNSTFGALARPNSIPSATVLPHKSPWRAPMSQSGSESVIRRCLHNVRIPSESGNRSALLRCRTSANSGLKQCSKNPSLNHLVGEYLHRVRNRDSECICGLHVNDQFEFARLHNRQIGRLRAPLRMQPVWYHRGRNLRRKFVEGHLIDDFGQLLPGAVTVAEIPRMRFVSSAVSNGIDRNRRFMWDLWGNDRLRGQRGPLP